MKAIQAAVAAYLQEALHIRTAEERSPAVGYPVVTVTVQETGTTLLSGGELCEHGYALTLRAASDRERLGAAPLLSRIIPALLRGIPYTDSQKHARVLHPVGLQTEGDQLTCSVTVCETLPRENPDGQVSDHMGTLHLGLG